MSIFNVFVPNLDLVLHKKDNKKRYFLGTKEGKTQQILTRRIRTSNQDMSGKKISVCEENETTPRRFREEENQDSSGTLAESFRRSV